MEATHPSHPRHKLKLMNCDRSYTCDGCDMLGFGKRYRCAAQCDYDLHEDCMFPSTRSISHSLFPGARFEFLYQPQRCGNCVMKKKDKCSHRICDACSKPIRGFNYHCRAEGWDLHPCCSKLMGEVLVDGVPYKLRKKLSSKCMWCHERDTASSAAAPRSWAYVSKCTKYQFHVHCAQKRSHDANLAMKRMTESSSSSSAVARVSKGGGWTNNKYTKMLKVFLSTIMSILQGNPLPLITSLADFFGQ